jgi:hypothetical protein
MATSNKLKISWKNDLRHSVGEQDVIRLRNQLKIIKGSPELRMSNYRLNIEVRGNNI